MKRLIPLLIFILILLDASTVFAEWSCRSSIAYRWRKGETELEVHWKNLIGRGMEEAGAKRKLDELAGIEKNRAIKVCSGEHENLAGCISSKFAANSHTYNSLSFSARKALEEAITTDCANSQGVCIETTASKPECEEKVEKSAEDEKAPEDGSEGKSKKKKKKKK